MHTNALDARRAMAVIEQAEVDGGSDGYALGVGAIAASSGAAAAAAASAGVSGLGDGSSTSGGWEASRGGGMGGGRVDANAAALVKRAKALGVPPLPPDLGAVRCRKYVPLLRYMVAGVGVFWGLGREGGGWL